MYLFYYNLIVSLAVVDYLRANAKSLDALLRVNIQRTKRFEFSFVNHVKLYLL